MKRQRIVVGAFFRINLPNGKYSYGRILENASYAFYDFVTDDFVTDISTIAKHKILFILSVYDDAITSGRWIKIGSSPLEYNLQTLPLKFIQDKLNPDNFELYDPNTGKTKKASKKDCIGLERAAVWEPSHVEERIVDYIMGRPNQWVERMKISSP